MADGSTIAADDLDVVINVLEKTRRKIEHPVKTWNIVFSRIQHLTDDRFFTDGVANDAFSKELHDLVKVLEKLFGAVGCLRRLFVRIAHKYLSFLAAVTHFNLRTSISADFDSLARESVTIFSDFMRIANELYKRLLFVEKGIDAYRIKKDDFDKFFYGRIYTPATDLQTIISRMRDLIEGSRTLGKAKIVSK